MNELQWGVTIGGLTAIALFFVWLFYCTLKNAEYYEIYEVEVEGRGPPPEHLYQPIPPYQDEEYRGGGLPNGDIVRAHPPDEFPVEDLPPLYNDEPYLIPNPIYERKPDPRPGLAERLQRLLD